MKVFEIQHANKTRDLITVANIEGVSACPHDEVIVNKLNINMKSSKQYTIWSTDKIYSLHDSHVTGKWEIVKDEITFEEFYNEVAIALIQNN